MVVRLMNKLTSVFRGKSKGVGLIETMIAIALLGIVAVAFLGGISIAFKALFIADERTTAQSLAQSQMEYVKNCTYNNTAPIPYEQINDVTSPDYPDYTFSVNVTLLYPPDDGIQKIIITIKHHDKEVLTLEDYKVKHG